MSHEVERMAYTGAPPWHGLGRHLSANEPIEVWAKEAGLDWNILEAPVQYSLDREEMTRRIFEQEKVLFRSDSFAPLSVVGRGYKVVQPREILEFYRDLMQFSGYQLETAGVLRGGRKIWALARTGHSLVLPGGDRSNGFVLLATACDGTLATTAQFTSIRVVCNNTLAVAVNGAEKRVRVPHRTDFNPIAVKKQLGVAISSWDRFSYEMRLLCQRKVTSSEASQYLRRVFTVEGQNATTAERAVKRTFELFEGHGRGAELGSAQGTAFGLLNSVTEYVDHMRRAMGPAYRLESQLGSA